MQTYLARFPFGVESTKFRLNRAINPTTFLTEPEQQPEFVKYVTLQKRKNKGGGWGLVATKKIRKHSYFALYLVQIKHADDVRDSTYAISVPDRDDLVGDICGDSVLPPTAGGLPFWGHFANEPTKTERENTAFSLIYNPRKVGRYALYGLYATETIRIGEECMWCYGESYNAARNYETSCSDTE